MSEEESVLDAVNAALASDGASNGTPEPEASSEPENEPEGDESPAPESESEGEPEGEPEGEETDAEAEARGAERDPVTGKFIKKGEEPTKPAEEKKKDEPPKKDPINDPIPTNLKKETSERIRSLIDTAKTVTAERDQVKQDFDYLIKGVEATGTSPEQYGETLSWLALFNSRDPASQEKALELVESVAERLATLLGKERAVGDPLSAHADLKDAVAKNQITLQYAKEIARTRNGQTFRTELTTNVQQQEQQKQQAQQEEADGRNALAELENTLRASDTEYEAKKAALVPTLKPVMESIPWKHKKDVFLKAYKAYQLPTAPRERETVPKNQPLRAKQSAGGQSKAPGSALEAMEAALSGMKK